MFLALWNTIEKIASEQRKVGAKKESANVEKPFESNVKALMSWINSNGCKISPKIQVATGLLEGNGIIAKDEIVEEEVLLEISPKVIFFFFF